MTFFFTPGPRKSHPYGCRLRTTSPDDSYIYKDPAKKPSEHLSIPPLVETLDLTPGRPIQGAVLDRFRDVFWLDRGGSFQVSNGACHLQNTVVSARAESLLSHGTFQEAFAIGGKLAVGPYVPWRHLRITVEFLPQVGKAGQLALPSSDQALANLDRQRISL